MSKKPRIGLVIGSGGIKCAAAIGVIQALEEAHIKVDLVVGCSGGAVFGAAVAMGFSSEKISWAREQGWTKDITKKLDFSALLKILAPGIYGFDDNIGIFDDTVMTKNLEKVFGAQTLFAETLIPFYCMATDFNTGKAVKLSEGGLVSAIRISSGIPLIFKPIERDGRLLIDGGLSNPLPIDVAIQEGADIIIALGFETPLLTDVDSPLAYASQMFNIMINQLLYKQFAFYNLAHHSEIIAVVPKFKEKIKVNAVEQIPMIVAEGKRDMGAHIPYLNTLLEQKKNL